jgi:hypothetical protein
VAKEPRYAAKEEKMASTGLTVAFIPNDKGNPPGQLADAELHSPTWLPAAGARAVSLLGRRVATLHEVGRLEKPTTSPVRFLTLQR